MMKLIKIEKGIWINPDKVIEVYEVYGQGKSTVIVLPDRTREINEDIKSVIKKLINQ